MVVKVTVYVVVCKTILLADWIEALVKVFGRVVIESWPIAITLVLLLILTVIDLDAELMRVVIELIVKVMREPDDMIEFVVNWIVNIF